MEGRGRPHGRSLTIAATVALGVVVAIPTLVGFGGRVLDQRLPKYLNSSETPLFHKGATLYGLYQAKDGIRKSDRVVLVEGYLDVIALSQHDISYAVATLGTALTVDHARVLSRYTKNIIALFDGDDAGQKAAARSFEVFVEAAWIGGSRLRARRSTTNASAEDSSAKMEISGRRVSDASRCSWRAPIPATCRATASRRST